MTTKLALFLCVAAFATNACTHNEEPRDPSNVEDADESAAPTATSEPTRPAATTPEPAKPAEDPACPPRTCMDEATRATFRGVITKPGARP